MLQCIMFSLLYVASQIAPWGQIKCFEIEIEIESFVDPVIHTLNNMY